MYSMISSLQCASIHVEISALHDKSIAESIMGERKRDKSIYNIYTLMEYLWNGILLIRLLY